MSKTLTIDVVSDYACPWCYVGKKRMELALEQCEGIEATVRFLPFQLSPDMPREGRDRREHMTSIFGADKVEAILGNQNGIGVEEGLVIRYVEGSKSPNTLSTHVVSQRALAEGKQSELSDKLFEAYFTNGENIGDHDVLLRIAEEVDINVEGLAEDLAAGVGEQSIEQQMAQYQGQGISGVPFFIINNKYGISGAQPVDVLVEAFNNISAETNEQNS